MAQGNEPNGASGGLVYINDHNFTDAAISTGGGFSITIDLNAYSTQGTGRYLSVGVGQSLAELHAQTSSAPTGSDADLMVAYRFGTGNLEFFKNKVRDVAATTSGQPAPPTKMRIDYMCSDFIASSTVNYSVFFDDNVTPIATGSFTWSGTNENYISLSSNLFLNETAGTRNALFDNLQIRTLGGGGGSDFDTWKTTNSTAGGLDDDHDGDGVSNGVEYFIGGPNGNTTGFTALPGVANDAGTLSVTFTKAADYVGVYGTDYEVQVSSTLASWSPAPGGTVTFPSATEVKYTFPAGTKNFAR